MQGKHLTHHTISLAPEHSPLSPFCPGLTYRLGCELVVHLNNYPQAPLTYSGSPVACNQGSPQGEGQPDPAFSCTCLSHSSQDMVKLKLCGALLVLGDNVCMKPAFVLLHSPADAAPRDPSKTPHDPLPWEHPPKASQGGESE